MEAPLAVGIVDRLAFHTGVSEDFLLKQDQFQELRYRLLKFDADFHGKLVAPRGKESDVASRRALAASHFQRADLPGEVGRKEEALAARAGGRHRCEGRRREEPDRSRWPAGIDGPDAGLAGGLPPVGVAAGGPGGVRPGGAGRAGGLPHAAGLPP